MLVSFETVKRDIGCFIKLGACQADQEKNHVDAKEDQGITDGADKSAEATPPVAETAEPVVGEPMGDDKAWDDSRTNTTQYM